MFKIFLLFAVSTINLFAAIPSPSNQAKNIIKFQGALQGGVAGNGFSLLKISKLFFPQTHSERWIVDVGDLKGKVNKGLPGYYHVQMVQNPPQMIVNFNQMPVSVFNEIELTKMIKSSVFVSKGKLLSDPTDKTLTMIFDLKKPAQLKVLQVKGQKETSKLVFDLFL